MLKGRVKKINWSTMTAPNFKIETKENIECGGWALHAITKVPYYKILPLGKSGHWSTKTMLNFLKRFGCEVTPITFGNVVESQSVKGGKHLLDESNVILIEQACFREENTWSVLFDGKISHSGEIDDIEPMEFINWPILQAYLVTHKKWKNKDRF